VTTLVSYVTLTGDLSEECNNLR